MLNKGILIGEKTEFQSGAKLSNQPPFQLSNNIMKKHSGNVLNSELGYGGYRKNSDSRLGCSNVPSLFFNFLELRRARKLWGNRKFSAKKKNQ
jgi:hypothetical protein